MNKFEIIKKYIDEYDLYDLLAIGAQHDEYNLEVSLINEQINKNSSIEEIGSIIQSVFSKTFGITDKFDINKCLEIAKKIKYELK